ncbi:Rhamnogalacturonase B, N-terminal-domain-containing protein [Stachybotrys elegans]|uniref:Rhamnogalacturonate lyase n=1 Tax=Stachybotrys elegans TaxID=80388 RepID=A0A8K0SMS2_9HYPO|nr:Rhamnogalacturonase B, N-terminal-domain-containing protein [Stachybotrys elegans]
MLSLGRIAALALSLAAAPALAAFGFTQSGSTWTVDAGASNALVFVVNTACDITSLRYRGVELQSSTASHIGSGLGGSSPRVSVQRVSGSSQYVKVTCATSTLTHYYIVRQGDSTIYMGTYISAEPDVGELRYIARLRADVLPYELPFGTASTTSPSSATVEGSDVFVVNGQTRSKFYSSERFIDEKSHCIQGTSTPEPIIACMLIPSFETSSGGPFMRDINTNNVGSANYLFHYMNSGHAQTEPFRMGFHGPYYMQFSRTGVPTKADVPWYSELGLQGYVPDSDRGRVSGTASGVPSNLQTVLHWYNSNAQYWTYAGSGGAFTSPLMKPGTYTMVLYQNEYKVASTSVSVSRGATTSRSIASSLPARNTIWRIGEFDGQPTGFRNADKFLRMHPSDSRMSSWGPLTYTVGSSSLNDFSMAIFKDTYSPQTIRFNLGSVPSGTVTLRLATTYSFAGGRPSVTVNNWGAPVPPAPTKIDSRAVTRGAYRGNGEVYDFTIPSGTLTAGSNTIAISVASGSSGTLFLSPSFIMDAVELFT